MIVSTNLSHQFNRRPNNYALALPPCSTGFGSTSQRSQLQYVFVPRVQVPRAIVPKLILSVFCSTAIDVTSDQVKLHGLGSHTMANCYWDGTSPFCAGSCDTSNGWVECDKSGSGDGATCVTGYKKKCCKESCSSNVHTGELLIRCNCCLDITSAPPSSHLS